MRVHSQYVIPSYTGMQVAIFGHYMMLSGNSSVYDPLGYILDMKAKAWKTMPSNTFQLALTGNTLTLFNDKIILLGVKRLVQWLVGWAPEGTPEAFAIDLTTMTTERVPTYGKQPPFAFQNTANLYEERNQLVLFGGTTGKARGEKNDLNILSLKSMEWETVYTKGEKPPPVFRHCACIANHTLVVCGGISNTRANSAIHLVRLDQRHYVWQTIRPYGYEARLEHRLCCFSIGSTKILVFGGPENEIHILEGVSSNTRKWSRVLPAKPSKVRLDPSEEYYIHGRGPVIRLSLGAAQLHDKIVFPSPGGRELYEVSPL